MEIDSGFSFRSINLNATIVDKQKEIDRENNELTEKKCELIELTCRMSAENAGIVLDHFLEKNLCVLEYKSSRSRIILYEYEEP